MTVEVSPWTRRRSGRVRRKASVSAMSARLVNPARVWLAWVRPRSMSAVSLKACIAWASISRCCEVVMTTGSKRSGWRPRAWITGPIFIASGRVPRTMATRGPPPGAGAGAGRGRGRVFGSFPRAGGGGPAGGGCFLGLEEPALGGPFPLLGPAVHGVGEEPTAEATALGLGIHLAERQTDLPT